MLSQKLIVSILLASFASCATATGLPPGIVPPPDNPAVATAPPVAVSAPVPPVAVANVTPPTPVSGVGEGLTKPQPELVTLDLPSKPEGEPLKPAAPAPKKVKKPVKKLKAVADPEITQFKPSDDPFAGVLGMPVSDSQLNQFVFPEPVAGLYFPEGSPLPECGKDAAVSDPCKPVFLNGRRIVLLQLRAGAHGPVQMLVHMQSGAMQTLELMPARGPGSVIRIKGAEDGSSDERLAAAAATKPAGGLAASEQDVALVAQFARGDIPGGYEPADVGETRRYDLFEVAPVAVWSNGSSLKVTLSQVKAYGAAPVAVNAGLFRGEGIKAVALDRETVTQTKPALLYQLEQLTETP